MTSSTLDAVIIGAGPYGLATAAHLRFHGVHARVFGEVMAFCKHQMPTGMLLRSAWEASHISDPDRTLTLDAFQDAAGIRIPTPVPLDRFIEYGEWFRRQAVPDVDPRSVVCVQPDDGPFRVLLEDGEALQTQRVIVATGLTSFAYRPPQFSNLPPSLASHSSEHQDLGRFRGKQVIVIGGGQSALESAALMHEAGAEVEVIARQPRVRWLRRGAWLRSHLGRARPLLYPPTDVGPIGLNRIVAMPNLFRRLPRGFQHKIARRSIAPAVSHWLIPRLTNVSITTGRSVTSAIPNGNGVRLTLDDWSRRHADHVLLATGYRIDVTCQPFLVREIARSLQCVDGNPRLNGGFESSVPGLYFLGASSAETFGPVMRFVSGTPFAARTVTRRMLRRTEASVGVVPAFH
jgi:hypothetical protein